MIKDMSKEHTEWISVEDAMPEDGVGILAYHEDWGIEITKKIYFNDYINIGLVPDARASHWMPLPDAPQGLL